MSTRLAIALLGTAALVPLCGAQVRGAGMGTATRAGTVFEASSATGHGINRSLGPGIERFHQPAWLWGAPYLYANYSPQPAVIEAPPPQVVVVQVPPPAEAPKEARGGPLLIEWQGDRYVRFGGTEGTTEGAGRVQLDYAEAAKPAAIRHADRASVAAPVLPPAVLVYRDGHHEAIADYTIVGGTIYARGDYWRDGYWTKKIQLASIDLPATLKASQDNGVRFVLPSSPSEVVTRP